MEGGPGAAAQVVRAQVRWAPVCRPGERPDVAPSWSLHLVSGEQGGTEVASDPRAAAAPTVSGGLVRRAP